MKVSIVVPCRNEVNNIEDCIDAIYSSSICTKENIEVLIIDGDSDDGTVDLLKSLQSKHPTLQIIRNEKKVTPVAFNLGVKNAKGEYIQIIGARQIISSNYLEDAIAKFEETPEIWCIGGAVENIFENETSETISKAMDTPFGVGGGNFRLATSSQYVDTVGTPMYPAFVFEKVGLFDEELVRNQDDEFNFRITQAGGKIFLLHTITIKYFVRASYEKLFKQYFQYGYWKVYVNKKLKTITTLRQLAPIFLVVYLLFGSLLTALFPILAAPFSLGITVYLIAGAYFAFDKGKDINEGLNIWKSFFILHFGYGLGYLKGILDFMIMGKGPSSKQTQLTR